MKEPIKFYVYYDTFDIPDITVYAYTDDKKIAKKFEKTRDMKRFYKKVIKGTSEDRKTLLQDYADLELELYKLCGKNFSTEIPITKWEKFTIVNMGYRSITIDIPLFCNIFPFIFANDIREALVALKYVEVYKFLNGHNDLASLEEIFSVDTMELFLQEYGFTLSL